MDKKKGTGQLEDNFLKTMPIEHDRMLKSYSADSLVHMAQNDR